MKALEKLLHFFRGDGLHRHALRQAFGKRMVGDHMALMSGGIIPAEGFQGRNGLLQKLRRFAAGYARRQPIPLGFHFFHFCSPVLFSKLHGNHESDSKGDKTCDHRKNSDHTKLRGHQDRNG